MTHLLLFALLTFTPTPVLTLLHDLAIMQAEGGRMHEVVIHEAPGPQDRQQAQLQWEIQAFTDSLVLHVYIIEAQRDSARVRNRALLGDYEGPWSAWGIYKEGN